MTTGNEQDHLDLDKVMQEGLEKFEGELAEAASDDSDQPGSQPASPADQKPPEHPETPEEKPADTEESPPEHPEEGPAETEETPPEHTEEKPSKPRFKSHQEAEEGYRNLQSKTTKAEQENARLKKELDELKGAKEREQEAERLAQEFETFAADKYREALEAIDELDPDDDGYNVNVSKIWAKRDGDIRRFEREHGTTGVQPAQPGTEEQPAAEIKTDDDARTYVAEQAQEAGIDPEDPGWQFLCTQAPSELDGRKLSFEEQVQWALDEKKNYDEYRTSRQKQTEQERQAAAKKRSEEHQEKELSLGRGASSSRKKGAEEESKPVSLNDALDAVMEERRL